jgi:hypothetical protein
MYFLVTEESETLQGCSAPINTPKTELFSSFWDTSFPRVNTSLICSISKPVRFSRYSDTYMYFPLSFEFAVLSFYIYIFLCFNFINLSSGLTYFIHVA